MKVTMKPYTVKYTVQGQPFEWTHVLESKQGAINRFTTDYFYPIARSEINLPPDHLVDKYMPSELMLTKCNSTERGYLEKHPPPQNQGAPNRPSKVSIKGRQPAKFCPWTAFLSRAHMFWYTEKMYARERGDTKLEKMCTAFIEDINMKVANRGR